MKRRYAAALIGSAPFALGHAASAQASTIRIATAPADSYGLPFFAADGGFYARAGLNVDLTLLPNGGAITNAMGGNAVDVGIADPINVANAINAGFPVAILAGCGLYSSDAPTTLLVVGKNSALRTPKDLEGQTVGVVALASITSLALQEWLRNNNVDVRKVNFIEMPFPSMTPALTGGRVAAAMLSEPFITDGRADIRVFGKAFDAVAKSFYISVWFASQAWITKNPDAAKRLVQTIYESARWANTHHADTAPILVKYTKADPARTQSMTRVMFATSLELNKIQPMLDIGYRHNQLQKPVRAAEMVAKL